MTCLRRLSVCLRLAAALAALAVLAACGPPPDPAMRDDVAGLEAAIAALGPDVDPAEAARAAAIAYAYTAQLAAEYQITDPPIRHNQKVNMGLKPRGLCWHWAEDIKARLAAEGFRTLEMHRAIAEHPIRISHSTAIISARGGGYAEGLVLDPWRYGGVMHWVPVGDDTRYAWRDQKVVLKERRAALIERAKAR